MDMKYPRYFVMAGSLVAVLLIVGGGTAGYRLWNQSQEKKRSAAEAKKDNQSAPKNFFEINDEAAGVFFKVGKSFRRMSSKELQAKNPNFLYGFASDIDKDAHCAVSQTKRSSGGGMRFADVEKGVLDQLKKHTPDVIVESREAVDVGDGKQGARLNMAFTHNGTPMLQQEVVALTDKNATFALCVFPKAVLDFYREDVNLFLGSLRVK
jgi:hypothetical protein